MPPDEDEALPDDGIDVLAAPLVDDLLVSVDELLESAGLVAAGGVEGVVLVLGFV